MMKQKQQQRRYRGGRKRDTNILVRVSKREHQSLHALAAQRGVSLSDMVRSLLQEKAIQE
jgi:predicted HicB family RNase H-like nuclease